MPNVHIVTDSSSDLSQGLVEKLGVSVVPLSIRFGDEEYRDGVDLTATQFYEKMAGTEVLPETAAPSPGAFEQVFRGAADRGAPGVVCVNLSSKLSATMAAAESAARAVEGTVDVRVVDSLSVTMGTGSIVIEAAEMAADGASVDQIAQRCGELERRTHVFGVLDTLENLKKGGRIGSAKALLGSLLSVKPALDISSGEVVEAGKLRTRRKALEWLRDKLYEQADPQRLAIVHGGAPDFGELCDMISDRYPAGSYATGIIGPTIGAHAGPRVLGICYQDPA
jgi:DegV family protein with EDD domain